MSYVDWKSHGEETLAAYLPESELKGVLEKRVAVSPDCAAIVIRDGKVVSALQGAHLSVGGLWQSFKELIGGSHALRVLVADLKPFQKTMALAAFTRDKVEVFAELAVELALNPEKPADVMGLVSKGTALVRDDVVERIRPLIQERVLMREVVTHDHNELRANTGLQDRIQAELMREVERVVGDMGLMVRSTAINFALNAEEQQAIQLRSMERLERMVQAGFERAQRDVKRESEGTLLRLETTQDVERLKRMNDGELAELMQANQLRLADHRTAAMRLEQRRQLTHELESAQERREAVYKDRLANVSNERDSRKIELDRRRDEMEFDNEMRRQGLELRKLEALQELELKKTGQLQDLDVGAQTALQGIDIDGRRQLQGLDIADRAHDVNYRKLTDLQKLELEREAALRGLNKNDFMTQHNAEMERRMHETQAEFDKLKLQSTMSPDVLLAIQAGASPHVAAVFAEKARAMGSEKEALLREMMKLQKDSKTESDAQAREMFDRAVDSLARVGAARMKDGHGGGGGADDDDAAECPQCHHKVPVAARFCRNCGHQMRV
ncbi:MAG: zinc ribbon domain-containing protein [Planctomycetota bacterium]